MTDVDLSWGTFDANRPKGAGRPAAAKPAATGGGAAPADPLDPKTVAVIKQVQKANGLPVTGQMDAATVKFVNGYKTPTGGSGSGGSGGSASATKSANKAKAAAAKAAREHAKTVKRERIARKKAARTAKHAAAVKLATKNKATAKSVEAKRVAQAGRAVSKVKAQRQAVAPRKVTL